MIAISFIIKNVSEEEAAKLLQQIADHTIEQINQHIPKPIITGTPWVYRRESKEPGEPKVALITREVEHYLWASATALDTPPYEIWSFDFQCPNHSISVPDRDSPEVHILKPDQVSTLFKSLAINFSKMVKVEVSYNDDHTRTGLIYQNGNVTEEEHW